MLKKVGILLLALGLAFGLMWLTTQESRFRVQSSYDYRASQSEVWQALQAVDNWPEWWPGVERVELLDSFVPGASVDIRLSGVPAEPPARFTSIEKPIRLIWERPGVLKSYAGTGFYLEETAGGCRLRVENHIRGPQAFLARITGEEAFRHYQQQLLERLDLYLQGKLQNGGKKD